MHFYLSKKIVLTAVFNMLAYFFVVSGLYAIQANLKGTYAILNDDYKYLSLIHGAIAWETGLIRNMYDYGQIYPKYEFKNDINRTVISGYTNLDQTHRMIRLVYIFFYRIPGSAGISDFCPTIMLKNRNTNFVAGKLAELIALIIKAEALWALTVNAFDVYQLANTELQTINDAISFVSQLEISTNKQLKNINVASGIKENIKVGITEKTKRRATLLPTKIDNCLNNPANIQDLKSITEDPLFLHVTKSDGQPIKEFIATLARIDEWFNALFTQVINDHIKPLTLSDIIMNALIKEQKILYPNNMLYSVLLGFLYAFSSKDRASIQHFYTVLHQSLDGKILKKNFSSDWLDDSYEPITAKEALDRVKLSYEKAQNDLSFDDLAYYILQINSFPNLATTTNTYYQYTADARTTEFPDCMENAIRNFINLLAYDVDANKFSVQALKTFIKNPNHPINNDLVKFITKFYKVNDNNSDQVHQEWISIVSNIPYVTYMKSTNILLDKSDNPKNDFIRISKNASDKLKSALGQYRVLGDGEYGYEIRPSLKNLILIINHLLNLQLFDGVDDLEYVRPDFNKQYFPLLCSKLKFVNYFVVKNEADEMPDTKVDIDALDFSMESIRMKFFLNKHLSCCLKTYQNHGELYVFNTDNEANRKLIKLLRDFKVSDQSEAFMFLEQDKARFLYEDDSSSIAELVSVLLSTQSNMYVKLFFLPLENSQTFISFTYALSKYELPLNPVLAKALTEFFLHYLVKVSSQDTRLYIQKNISCFALKRDIFLRQDEMAALLKNLYDNSKSITELLYLLSTKIEFVSLVAQYAIMLIPKVFRRNDLDEINDLKDIFEKLCSTGQGSEAFCKEFSVNSQADVVELRLSKLEVLHNILLNTNNPSKQLLNHALQFAEIATTGEGSVFKEKVWGGKIFKELVRHKFEIEHVKEAAEKLQNSSSTALKRLGTEIFDEIENLKSTE